MNVLWIIGVVFTNIINAEGKTECQAWEPDLTEDYFAFNQTCYLVYSEKMEKTWDEAAKYCKRFNGQLAKIKDIETDAFLCGSRLKDGDRFWIGLQRTEAEESNGYQWTYTDGELSTFSLLTHPPNYMETTVRHTIWVEVWNDLETCPWTAAQPTEKHRFICQYTLDKPSYQETFPYGIKAPEINAPIPVPTTTTTTTLASTTTTTLAPTTTTATTTTTLPPTTTATTTTLAPTTTTTTLAPTTATTLVSSTTTTTTTTKAPTTTTQAPTNAETLVPTTAMTTTTTRPSNRLNRQFYSRRIHYNNVKLEPSSTISTQNSLKCFVGCSNLSSCVGISIQVKKAICHMYTDKQALSPANKGQESGWLTFEVYFITLPNF